MTISKKSKIFKITSNIFIVFLIVFFLIITTFAILFNTTISMNETFVEKTKNIFNFEKSNKEFVIFLSCASILIIILILIILFIKKGILECEKEKNPFSYKSGKTLKIISFLIVINGFVYFLIEKLLLFIFNDASLSSSFSFNFSYIWMGIALFIFSFLWDYICFVQQKMKQTVEIQEQIILSFAEITEAKSGQTGHHIKRVSEYCRIIALNMGFKTDEVEKIRIASMMHDVGKLMIPLDILEKPGKLNDVEYEEIKKHVILGEQLLHNTNSNIMNYARTIALEHHEKWDGTGYLGKKGEEINIISRVSAVADVYDALVSNRSYKDAWDEKKAYNIIVSEKGKHFDPIVVDAFVKGHSQIVDTLNKFKD